jgi:hypothetical protein
VAIIPRTVAFIVVSIGLAFLLHFFDNQKLAEIYSTPPDVYIVNELDGLHQRGFFVDFVVSFLLGAFYLGAVEIVAYVVRKTLRRYFILN